MHGPPGPAHKDSSGTQYPFKFVKKIIMLRQSLVPFEYIAAEATKCFTLILHYQQQGLSLYCEFCHKRQITIHYIS